MPVTFLADRFVFGQTIHVTILFMLMRFATRKPS